MGKPRCVGLKVVFKEIFDDALEKPVGAQVEETIKTLVNKNKNKGLSFDDKCKDGWMLTANVTVKTDDPAKPTKLEVKVVVDGVPLFGTADGFKATGNAKASGINPKKLEQDAKAIVEGAVDDLMSKQAIPHMLKS